MTARHILEHGPHCILTGSAANKFGERNGFDVVENSYFATENRRLQWEQKLKKASIDVPGDLGTVGAAVLDSYGNIAAAESTGGIAGQSSGRIGDTAVLGAGLYADSSIGIVW